ncbi:sodium:calcium symporter [Prosthecobacter sp.]|uniref:sodium:calcium symporter n=1 Tax=Prosthecobacter sp. TaxID=1965333 RepID=UPI003783EFC1
MSQKKESWSSRLGVIMAVAGSAVGLGNFLRFPGLAAQYGGGAFMMAYAISFLIIALPIGWAEWAMGRYAGSRGYHSAPGAFAIIIQKPWAKYAGVIAVIIPVVIYLYYVVIEGWCLGYAVNFWSGRLDLHDAQGTVDYYNAFTGAAADAASLEFSMDKTLPWLLLVFVFNFWLIYRGLSAGIEKMCNFGLPLLIVLAMVVLVRVLTLGAPDPARPHDNVGNGLGYMWNPSKVQVVPTAPGADAKPREVVGSKAIAEAEAEVAASHGTLALKTTSPWMQLANPSLWLAAAGQIFFSLAVGFGIIIVYASYMRPKDDVVLSGLTASSANEFCEVALGGLITVPAAVAFLGVAGIAGQAGVGLGFKVLPLVFARMPAGAFFGGAFFFMLFLAAITSSIAMLQPGIAFLEEALGVGRRISVALLAFLTTAGTSLVAYFTRDLKALDTLDFWGGTFLIFTLATIQIIVFGWVWGIDRGFAEMNKGAAFPVPRLFRPIVRWVCPAFLLTIFAMWLMKEVLGIDLVTFQSGAASSYVTDLIGRDARLPAQLSIGLLAALLLFFLFLAARSKAFRRAEQGLDNHSDKSHL